MRVLTPFLKHWVDVMCGRGIPAAPFFSPFEVETARAARDFSLERPLI